MIRIVFILEWLVDGRQHHVESLLDSFIINFRLWKFIIVENIAISINFLFAASVPWSISLRIAS